MAEGTRLESVRGSCLRGFKSHSFRQLDLSVRTGSPGPAEVAADQGKRPMVSGAVRRGSGSVTPAVTPGRAVCCRSGVVVALEGSIYRKADEARQRRDAALAAAPSSGPRAVSIGGLDGSVSIEALSRWWLDTVARYRIRPSSFGRYEDRVSKIVDGLCEIRLKDRRPEQIATWQSGLMGALSPGTCRTPGRCCARSSAKP